MARKAAPEPAPHRGFNDIIGIVLMGSALLLLAALFSYHPFDTSDVATPPNNPVRNVIGPFGAWMAHKWLLWVGFSAYLLPFILVFLGLGCFFELLSYVRRRWIWTVVLFVCCMGLLDLYSPWLENAHKRLCVPPGGILGTNLNQHIFGYFGTVGATIIFLMLYFISFLFLTNFQLGDWIRAIWARKNELRGLATTPPAAVAGAGARGGTSAAAGAMTAEEKALEKRARELEKQARKLQDQVDKTNPGLGADMQPVPEPTVRDLSVPQSKPAKGKKPGSSEPAKEPAPPEDAIIIPAREIAAATSADVLGKKTDPNHRNGESKADETAATEDKPGEVPGEPVVAIAPAAVPGAPAARPRMVPKKPKPIAVASTPRIGNYQLPTMDFLQHPDTTLKPTESKEELMANARLMQQTLAQFDIEVALGDITKGPTITRYELHPAPGVKLEKITALNNNIAAVLKAERINILAPVPGKSSVGVEVPNAVKTKVIMRDLLESDEWVNTKARIPLALGKDVYGHPIIADLAEMPHLLIAGSTGSGKSVCINSIIASLLYKFSPDEVRFVMIDPKVVELQQYNVLPHLVVPVVTDPKKVILALRWVVNEMEKRYQIFARVGVRNIKSFNERPKNKPIPVQEPELPLMAKKEKVEPGADGFAVEVDEEIVVPREEDIVIPEKLSYIVVIIDELADLMLVAPADVEMAIARITQMARAAGIHCIVATQRPSVDVITGVIKANIPARIAFQVAAK
ncbi:MAG: spoIIIE, partial [Pedosphaera sp.]|nr:spoIIIE [Pedosphaera sp.]